ncbi:hypothetical protein [Stutzerimonas zhaodongensis]|uniref:hypothetical protein n=1 Tax=Stutzerimonas TaxID=2901164 RepID=UPI0038907E22
MSLTLLGRLDRLHNLSHECAELRITGFQSPAEDDEQFEEASLSAFGQKGTITEAEPDMGSYSA